MSGLSRIVCQAAVLLVGVSVLAACNSAPSRAGLEWFPPDAPRLMPPDTIRLLPSVRIKDGPDFWFTYIPDGFFDSRGRLWVVDMHEAVLYVFHPEGRLLQKIGRRGEGPGEFMAPEQVAPGVNDSVYVWDIQLKRLSVFSPEGEFVRSFTMDYGYELLRGVPEGLLATYLESHLSLRRKDQSMPQLQLVRLLDYHGRVLKDTLLAMEEAEFIYYVEGNLHTFYPPPFGRRPFFQVDMAGNIWYGWNEILEIGRLDWRRQQEKKIRYAIPRLPVPESFPDSLRRRSPDEWRRITRGKYKGGKFRFPEYQPAFADLRVSPRGRRVWVRLQQYYGEFLEGELKIWEQWVVLDGDGQPLALVLLPPEGVLRALSDTHLARVDYVDGEFSILIFELPEFLHAL
ncbi:6-bladed beta-propeller [Rhodothermus marinus]|uniref:6-bladed beta-propeller n=1 Tax=Rhodothermus marinus TaxID=29549 RepID=UPI0037CB5C0E